jgi:hypothetical protein
MEWGLDSARHMETSNISCKYGRIFFWGGGGGDGATKVSEGSVIVLGMDGDVKVLNVLSYSLLFLFGLNLHLGC